MIFFQKSYVRAIAFYRSRDKCTKVESVELKTRI